jgi:hypothetical protein
VTPDFRLDFKNKINTIEKVNDIFLVLLEVEKGSTDVDNLYGVDKYGVIIWRIQSIKEALGIAQNTPYISLKVIDFEKAQVTSFFGMRFTFCIHNGQIFEKECIGW